MRRQISMALVLMLLAPLPIWAGPVNENGEDEILLVRYACLIGGRDGGEEPTSAGLMSSEELSRFLLDWEPESDNAEVREVLALNHLGELARQASQLPMQGGHLSSVFAYGDSNFEVQLAIEPAKTDQEEATKVLVHAQIRRNGRSLADSEIITPFQERAIISAVNGPDAPFVFLVVEVDRISTKELALRGLRHAWSKDFKLVDGETIKAPVAIVKTGPAYPEEARKEKLQGAVVLRMIIDEQGKVQDIEIVQGQPMGLSEAAVAAARTWTFEPALYQDKPVAVIYMVTVNFRLE